jgi:DNA-binding beta-propeller fold protein YncE
LNRLNSLRTTLTLGVMAAGTALAVASAAGAAPPGTIVIKAPGTPVSLSVGFGSVWVADHRGGFIYRIDPRTNRSTAIYIGGQLCSPLALGAGAVWVVDSCFVHDTVYKIDPRTNRIAHSRIGGLRPVFAAGSLWTTTTESNRILRVDPRSGLVLAKIQPGFDVGGLTLDDYFPLGGGYGSLWVYGGRSVSRIDTATNKVTDVIPLPGAKRSSDVIGGYAFGGYAAFAYGKVWVTNPAGLFEIDPTTNVARLLPFRVTPSTRGAIVPVAAGRGSVWLLNSDTTILRIEPATASVIGRYRAARDGSAGSIGVAFGSLWVVNPESDAVWREQIP